jgi:hypothetical protein
MNEPRQRNIDDDKNQGQSNRDHYSHLKDNCRTYLRRLAVYQRRALPVICYIASLSPLSPSPADR